MALGWGGGRGPKRVDVKNLSFELVDIVVGGWGLTEKGRRKSDSGNNDFSPQKGKKIVYGSSHDKKLVKLL